MRSWRWWLAALICGRAAFCADAPVAPGGALTPPASLVFGDPAVKQRVVPRTALEARSGGWRMTVISADRLTPRDGAQAQCRLLLWLRAERGALPAELQVVEPPLVTDGHGQGVTAGSWRVVRADDGSAWVSVYLPATVQRLTALALSLGVPAPAARMSVRLDLEPLGTPRLLPELGLAVEPTLVRHDTVVLDTSPAGPPYFYALESTAPRAMAPTSAPPPDEGTYYSVRLHTLGPEPGAGEWELTDLRARDGDGPALDDWRFVRRPWRPDWGGWLGVTGTDAVALGGRPAGVVIDAVEPTGPGAEGGLRVGDVVTAIDQVPCRDAYTLGGLVRRRSPGSRSLLTLWRGGKGLTMTLPVGRTAQWPDRDEAEFQAVWSRLGTVRGGEQKDDVLNAWDWQARQPVTAAFEPTQLELVFTRQEPADSTTFLLRGVPLAP
ncbi:MAG: PDZ domain-containing protein [Armatimonadetes bacterium]|nr:PDZ domain-containing protein [Armatimonadota bacterium]